MLLELPGWWRGGQWALAGIGSACLALEVWMVVEAAVMWRGSWGREGVEARGFEVVT